MLLNRVLRKVSGVRSLLNKRELITALQLAGMLKTGTPSPAVLLKAVKAWQALHGFKDDGIVGDICARVMSLDRQCQHPDVEQLNSSVPKWKHSPVTISHDIDSIGQVPASEMDALLANFVDEVQQTCGVVMEVVNGSANIEIHRRSIDGRGGVLGDAGIPVSVSKSSTMTVRLDAGEHFVVSATPPAGFVDLQGTLFHEACHALGLRHAPQNGPPTLMAPYKTAIRHIQTSDARELVSRYGQPVARRTPVNPITAGLLPAEVRRKIKAFADQEFPDA